MPPPNETAATAAAMTVLPYSTSLDVSGATSPNFDVWWSYTAGAGDNVLGFWAFSEVGGLYAPVTTVWTGPDAGTLSLYLGGLSAANKPLQIPVVPGSTYWFRVRQSDAGVVPDINLTVSALRGADSTAAAGSILVNDDTAGFPAVLVDVATGEPLQFVQDFPAGEGGDTLAGGEILVNDFATDEYQLWIKDPVTGILSYDSTPIASGASDVVRANRTLDEFAAVLNTNPRTVRAIGSDGTSGPLWTLTGNSSVFGWATNNTRTVGYFSQAVSGAAVKRWDLSGDVALSDFVAGAANYFVRDILALSDGTILFSSVQTVFGEITVYRYTEAGALQNTYGPYDSAIPAGTQPRIGYNNTGDASFWLWTHGETTDEGLSTFRRIRVTDGVVLDTVVVTEYEGGVYNRAETASPSSRFGVSYSCPFLMTTVEYEPPGGGTPPDPPEPPVNPSAYTTESIPRRRLRRSTHIAADEMWLYFSRLQLILEAGVGTVTGQGVDPQIMLRWSDDGGHTWSNQHWVSAGRMGRYTHRAIWRRLGRGRDRVFEITVSDPVPWRLIGSVLDVDRGVS